MADVGWAEVATVSSVVLGGAWAVVKAIISPHVTTLKEHGERLGTIEKNGATSETLKDTETTILNAIREGNADIITRIGAVDRKADEAHRRINDQQEKELDRLRAQAGGHRA
jgi:hypothetical protein